MTKDEIRARELQLAAKVCSLTSGTLLLNMRFLAKALSRLPAVSYEGTFACDGRNIRYDPHYLLGRYKKSERLPVHDMLHMVLHCIFRHWYIGEDIDSEVWSAACDIDGAETLIDVRPETCLHYIAAHDLSPVRSRLYVAMLAGKVAQSADIYLQDIHARGHLCRRVRKL